MIQYDMMIAQHFFGEVEGSSHEDSHEDRYKTQVHPCRSLREKKKSLTVFVTVFVTVVVTVFVLDGKRTPDER